MNPSLPGPIPDQLIRQIIRDELASFWSGAGDDQGATLSGTQNGQETQGGRLPRRRRLPQRFGGPSVDSRQAAQGLAAKPSQGAPIQSLQPQMSMGQPAFVQPALHSSALATAYPVQTTNLGFQSPSPANSPVYPYAPQALSTTGYPGTAMQPPSQAFAIAHAQLTQSMQYNLEKLKTVIEETQLIAQQMEELLAQAGEENRKDKSNQPQDWQKGQQTDGVRRRQRQSGNA